MEEIKELIDDEVGGYIDSMLNERLLGVLSTKENVNLETLGFVGDNIKKYQAIINPIDIAGERLGTVFMYKSDSQYEIDDIILSEYGTTVASKIADRVGITRSVIVNALRKFESAGVIESRSSGMKGTYIKVLNDVVFDELAEIKKQKK